MKTNRPFSNDPQLRNVEEKVNELGATVIAIAVLASVFVISYLLNLVI